ncbi:hypothetical protein CHUAL_000301 [Chamberlinius hualienensis]
MFCEGLYLHTILVIAFVDKESIMKWLYVIGWVIPIILTIVYAAVRNSFPEETEHCWINESLYCWIIKSPVYMSMLANLVFLINIVKVLVTKLRAVNSSDTDQTIKAVRATIILIPLLGLHYFITPFRPEPKSSLEFAYGVVSAIVTSFQGFAVALLFCFFNAEIIFLIQKEWHCRKSCRGRTSSFMTSLTTLPNNNNDSWRNSSARRLSHLPRSSGKCKSNKHICLADITPPPKKAKTSTTSSNNSSSQFKTTAKMASNWKIGRFHRNNHLNNIVVTKYEHNEDAGELL